MAVASLALAACGGGDSVKTIAQPAPVRSPEPPVRPEPDCTMEPRPAGCPAVVPMPLAGLSQAAKGGAARALVEASETNPMALTGRPDGSDLPHNQVASHLIQYRNNYLGNAIARGNIDDFTDTKYPRATPSGSAGDISYMFKLYHLHAKEKDGSHSASFATGMNQFSLTCCQDAEKIFSLSGENAFTSVKNIPSIASQLGEGWDYTILQASVPSVKDGDKDSTLYAEIWTDYASVGKNDYMVGGWWLLAPSNPDGDYRFGAFARGEKYYSRTNTGTVKAAVTGGATYKGNAAGLHTSSENGTVSIQRLLGKVTLTADFGTTAASGTIKGKINNLTLDGESTTGQILLPEITFAVPWDSRPIRGTNDKINPKVDLGNIKGVNHKGMWVTGSIGDSSGTDQPTGFTGVVGGSGGGNSFVASFGAKKVEEKQ